MGQDIKELKDISDLLTINVEQLDDDMARLDVRSQSTEEWLQNTAAVLKAIGGKLQEHDQTLARVLTIVDKMLERQQKLMEQIDHLEMRVLVGL